MSTIELPALHVDSVAIVAATPGATDSADFTGCACATVDDAMGLTLGAAVTVFVDGVAPLSDQINAAQPSESVVSAVHAAEIA